MDILIIGGTRFVGRHLVEAALEAGHHVTLFHRGKTNPGVYPQAEHLMGDRDGGLETLRGRRWDAVVDICGYVPRVVRQSAELLRDQVERYVFISSISVYADSADMSETGALHTVDDPTSEDIPKDYGGLKALCERVIGDVYGERAVCARPGFIVGRYDVVPRLPALISRFERDGEKIAGRPEQPAQFIHARDIADWCLGVLGQSAHGAYNLTGQPVPMRTLLETLAVVTGKQTPITYTADDFLSQHEIAPVDGLTYWIPAEDEAFMRVPIDKALATGLRLHPLEWTLRDTVEWFRRNPFNLDEGIPNRSRLTAEREAELLHIWHARHEDAS